MVSMNLEVTVDGHPGQIGLYSKQDVLRITTLSDTTLWRRVRDGGFPAPIRISANRVAWPKSAVDRWIDEKTAPLAVAS